MHSLNKTKYNSTLSGTIPSEYRTDLIYNKAWDGFISECTESIIFNRK